jgi:prepilin-type N-terminal cleavage/methylation domain-containing protein
MSHSHRDSGVTLLELLVTIGLMGVLMAIAVGGWMGWAKANAQSGAARSIQSAMRQAQQRAVTEGGATCFLFDDAAESYSIYRGACTLATKTKVTGPVQMPRGVAIASPDFTGSGGTHSTGATFASRGTGSPGLARVTRSGSSKTYTLTVDWLTGRVSLS